ncbi:MAG TPA: hypothetical protein EYP64_04765 [Desulfarculaceae bacterium]|nr:hypothetical protein [Desulfarculaceae bacterium]
MIKNIICKADLPEPWQKFSYDEILSRPGGELVNDGRASRVFRFIDGKNVFYLKRYIYHKIHWQYCWQKSQVKREFENLEKIKQTKLGCDTVEIIAYGEERRFRTIASAFLLSREVRNGERLSLFLSTKPNHPQRKPVIEKIIALAESIVMQKIAITDYFFRNIVVVPQEAKLFLLDIQHCNKNQRWALKKSYPQLWSNILLFFSPEEQEFAAQKLLPLFPYHRNELDILAQQFVPKEKKRKLSEITLATKGYPKVNAEEYF